MPPDTAACPDCGCAGGDSCEHLDCSCWTSKRVALRDGDRVKVAMIGVYRQLPSSEQRPFVVVNDGTIVDADRWAVNIEKLADDTERHECFDLDGTRVHGDPDMNDEARDAVRTVVAATEKLLETRGSS